MGHPSLTEREHPQRRLGTHGLPPFAVLSEVYVPGRSASANRWSGEAKKRAEIHQGRYPRRGAAAVEMGASCCFSPSRHQPQT